MYVGLKQPRGDSGPSGYEEDYDIACLGTESQRAIWFILSAHRASQ